MRNVAIILNYNDANRCINLAITISKFYYINEVVIVDNCSSDNSMEKLSAIHHKNISVLKTNKNGGYAYGYNYGIKHAINKLKADNIFVCNSDIIIEEKVINRCIKFLEIHDEYGIVSATMLNSNGVVEMGYWKFPSYSELIKECFFLTRNKIFKNKKFISNNGTLEVDAVRGSFMCCKASCIQLIGGFDENTFLYFEENILGKKMKRAGYKVGVLVECTYIHNHINKGGFSASGVKLSLTSMLYYANSYCEYSRLKMNALKILVKMGKIEIELLNQIRKLKNKIKK